MLKLNLKVSRLPSLALRVAVVSAALLPFGTALAAIQTWTGAADGNWDTTTNNWTGTWTNNNEATFTSGGANQNITIASGVTVQSTGSGATNQVILVTGGNYTFGGTLAIANAVSGADSNIVINGGGSATFNGLIDMSSGTTGKLVLNPTGAGSLTINGGISAGSHAIQLGAFTTGTLNLSGGSISTTGTISLSLTTVNINGTAAVSTTNSWVQNNSTSAVTVSSASTGASLSFGGTESTSVIGKSNVAASLTVQNGGSVTSSGGLSVVNGSAAATNSTSTLSVTGGTLTVGGTGITLFRGNAADNQGNAVYTQSGGVATTTGITFGRNTAITTSTAASASMTLSGGELYVGATGIVKTAGNTALTTSITLSGGTLGANADWTSAENMTLTNGGSVTIKAAKADGTSQNITLSGVLSGGGGFTKSGAGTLTLSNASDLFGSINITAGIVSISNDDTILDTSNMSISGTGVLNLSFSGTDTISMLSLGGVAQPIGTYDSSNSGGFITGAGILNVTATAVPEPATWGAMGVLLGALAIVRRRRATRRS